MHPFLLIECPRMIFPYLRRIVCDITHDGGYPPLNLENIYFLALYRQELTRRAEAEKVCKPVSLQVDLSFTQRRPNRSVAKTIHKTGMPLVFIQRQAAW